MARLNGVFGGVLANESFTLSQTYYFGAVAGSQYECHQSTGTCIDLLVNLPVIYPAGSERTVLPSDSRPSDVTPETIAELESALQFLSSDDRGEWIAIGQALYELGAHGYRLWAEWSAKSPKHDPAQDLQRWETFSGERTNHRAVFAKAQRAGWVNPRQGSSVDTAQIFGGNGALPSRPNNQFIPMNEKLDEFLFPHVNNRGKKSATIENLEYLMALYGISCYYDELLKEGRVTLPAGHNYVNDMSEIGILERVNSLLALNEVPPATANRISAILMKNTCNPVKDFITGIPWDGVSRLEQLYNTVLVKPHDVPYRNKALRMWMVQCAAAVDGAGLSPIPLKIEKFECVLVFQGQQGQNKTTWVRSLLPQQYQEYILDGVTLDLSDKDSRKHAISGWIVELGELDGTFRKSDIAKLKGFLSNRTDEIRIPYDRKHSKFQRRTSFFASVNEQKFLVDETGNRRFIPLQIHSTNPFHRIDMQQLWAEVWSLYLNGEQWWPDAELKTMLESKHNDHEQIDHIEDAIRSKFNLDIHPEKGRIYTCTDILNECGRKHATKSDINAVGRVLRKFGFSDIKSNGIKVTRL